MVLGVEPLTLKLSRFELVRTDHTRPYTASTDSEIHMRTSVASGRPPQALAWHYLARHKWRLPEPLFAAAPPDGARTAGGAGGPPHLAVCLLFLPIARQVPSRQKG